MKLEEKFLDATIHSAHNKGERERTLGTWLQYDANFEI